MTNTPISQLLNLSSKTALVTGGAMGIGFGIATRLAQAGANVVIADINQPVGQAASDNLTSQGYHTAFINTDVGSEVDVTAAANFAVTTFGGLDILVNNAGIYPFTPTLQMDLTLFEKVLNINLKSVFLFTKIVATIMINQGRGGKIINITSIDALHPSMAGLAAYDASKHGVWGFTKNSALELAPHHITVNAIAPGGITTPGTGQTADNSQFISRIPLKRMGEIDDIGKVALFLASDLSSYLTGSQIVVDGGYLLT